MYLFVVLMRVFMLSVHVLLFVICGSPAVDRLRATLSRIEWDLQCEKKLMTELEQNLSRAQFVFQFICKNVVFFQRSFVWAGFVIILCQLCFCI